MMTVRMLQEKMQTFMGSDSDSDEEAYSRKYMKQKLTEYYGNDIIFAEVPGKSTTVTLQNKVGGIIDCFYNDMARGEPEEEKKKIIATAAHLIRNDIKLMSSLYVGDNYPSPQTLDFEKAEHDQPASLKNFMDIIIPGKKKEKVKKISIAQCIMQSAFPRKLMMPLQLCLAVHLHDYFASRYLNDLLTAIATHGKTDMQHVFEFELCPYAAPLAKSVTKMLPADKPKFLENLEQYSSTFFPGLENDV